MATFKQGYNLEVKWRLDGAGADTTLAVREHEAQPKVDELETTNTGSGGIEAYYAGITRNSGKVDFLIDIAAYAWGTVGITQGAKGTLKFNRGGTNPELAHVMITSFRRGSAVNGMLNGTFEWKLDSSATAQGSSPAAVYQEAS